MQGRGAGVACATATSTTDGAAVVLDFYVCASGGYARTAPLALVLQASQCLICQWGATQTTMLQFTKFKRSTTSPGRHRCSNPSVGPFAGASSPLRCPLHQPTHPRPSQSQKPARDRRTNEAPPPLGGVSPSAKRPRRTPVMTGLPRHHQQKAAS